MFLGRVLAVRNKYYAWLLREFPNKSSNFGLLYGRVYGPLAVMLRQRLNIVCYQSLTLFDFSDRMRELVRIYKLMKPLLQLVILMRILILQVVRARACQSQSVEGNYFLSCF